MIAEFRWRRPDSGSSHLFQLAHASLGLCCTKHPPSTTALTHRQNNARLLAHRFCVQDLFYILPSPRVPRSRESSVSRDSRSKAVYSTGLALRSDVMGLENSLWHKGVGLKVVRSEVGPIRADETALHWTQWSNQ